MSDHVEAEASFGAHGTIHSHPHLGRGTGGGDYEVVTHKVQLISLPGYFDVNLEVVFVVDLLQHVLVYLRRDLGFVVDLVVKGHD